MFGIHLDTWMDVGFSIYTTYLPLLWKDRDHPFFKTLEYEEKRLRQYLCFLKHWLKMEF